MWDEALLLLVPFWCQIFYAFIVLRWATVALWASCLQPLNISTKLVRKQNLNVFYQVCIGWADQKSKMTALPLIDWDIFNFFSVTAERNATKLDWKQDLNVIYQVVFFFGTIGDKRLPSWPLIGWGSFNFFSATAEQNSTQLDWKQDLNVLYQVCVLGRSEIQDGHPGHWLAETCSTSL